MNSRWPMVPLSEVIRHRKEFIEINDLDIYKRCRVQQYGQGIVLRDQVPGAEIKTKKQQVCHLGEFLVAEMDAKLGGYGVVPSELEGAIVSSHYFLFSIHDAKVERRFLAYFVQTPAFHDQVKAQGSTNYAAIRAAHVLEYRIPLPPVAEQRRLVERIDALVAKIDEATRLKRATQGECTQFWKVLSRMARSTSHPERPLGELVEFLDGHRVPLSETERSTRKGPYPYYGASGIIDQIDDFIFDQALLLLSEDGANLINRSTPIAFVAQGKYWVNNHAHVLRPIQAIAGLRFLEYALSDFDVSVFNFASAQAKLNQKNARQIRFAVPPVPEQERIVSYLDSLKARIAPLATLQDETQRQIDAMLPAILDRAFRGEP